MPKNAASAHESFGDDYEPIEARRQSSFTRVSLISDAPDFSGGGEELPGLINAEVAIGRSSSDEEEEQLQLFAEASAKEEVPSLTKKGFILVANSCASVGAVLATRYVLKAGLLSAACSSLLNQSTNVILYALLFVVYAITSKCSGGRWRIGLRPPAITARALLALLPGAIFFAGMLVCNNLCLKRLGVIPYQLARSVSLPFTLFMSWLVLQQRVSKNDIIGVSIVTFGFAFGGIADHIGALITGSPAAGNQVKTTLSGVIFGILGAACQTSYFVAMKLSFPLINNDEIALTFFTGLLGLPAIFIVTLYADDGFTPLFALMSRAIPSEFIMVALSIFCGCCVTFTTTLAVKIAGPVALGVTSYVKSILQAALAVLIEGDIPRLSSVFALVFTLSGSAWYSFGRIQARKDSAKGYSSPVQLVKLRTVCATALRHAAAFPTDNLREYFTRKILRSQQGTTLQAFEDQCARIKNLSDVLKRQSAIYSMYATGEVTEIR